jgi:uncharacterized RDD family membrane protein YckC
MSYDGPPPGPAQPGPPDPDPSDPGQPGAAGQQAAPYDAAAPNPYGAPGPNPYGAPGPNPYGAAAPNPYGAPGPNPYDAPAPDPYDASAPHPYGAPAPYGQQPAPAFTFAGYASWTSRVVAYVIDGFLGAVAGFPLWIGYALLFGNATTTTDADGVEHVHFHSAGAATALILAGVVTSLAFFIWNQCIRQGRTGASLGKSVLAIRLVHADMQPIGGGLAFVRYLLNIVNAIPCYLGYLWPIWDDKKQTFADKIMSTYVIKASEPQPPAY